MRLIDADALKTEVNFSVTITGKDNAVEVKRLMELYNKAINDAPTIEPETKCVARLEIDTEELVRRIKEEYDIIDEEQIVRCKDCGRGFGSPVCPIQSKGWAINKDTFFCAWGERREP